MSDADHPGSAQRIFLVFQMAKVASRSWSSLLHREFPDALVSHFHAISPTRISKIESLVAAEPPIQTIKHLTLPRLGRPPPHIMDYVAQGRWIGPPVTVVTGIRDPVARAISAVGFLCNRLGYERFPVTPRDGGTADNILTVFHRALSVARGQDSGGDTLITLLAGIIRDYDLWFAEELAPAFDFDITNEAFDHETRALLLNGSHKALIYRMEDLKHPSTCTQLLQTASGFLGKALQQFPAAGQSHETRYQVLYKQATEQLRLSQEALDWFYDNPTVTKFYSHEEISEFRTRWAEL